MLSEGHNKTHLPRGYAASPPLPPPVPSISVTLSFYSFRVALPLEYHYHDALQKDPPSAATHRFHMALYSGPTRSSARQNGDSFQLPGSLLSEKKPLWQRF